MLKATKKCYFNTLFFWGIVRNTLILQGSEAFVEPNCEVHFFLYVNVVAFY